MDEEASIILEDAIAFCQRDGQDARLINMLGQSRAVSLTEDTLTIEAPSRFAIAQLKKHQPTIEHYLEEIAFAPIALNIVAPQGPTTGATGAAPVTPPLTTVAPVAAPETNASDVSRETMPHATAVPVATAPNVSHMPVAHDAAPGEEPGIAIKNTLSADDFRRMMNQMRGVAPAKSAKPVSTSPVSVPTAAAPGEQNADGAPLVANSKFTFENFVYGPENSHAYRSALKFAALADERGTCTSLFIYGKSGLGKTHLLLAIKNELAEKSPEIKVKYANSQAYIDDLMTEFDRQKKSNAPIMQAYHGVDVLIIDDIQNIIGKRASVDYFFQLMDEFIRNNKKVVIAADRAPKDLNMDERLTSRFNAGMLCLVAEPSYEMKYKILQRYYENTIAAAPEAGDDSLLAAYGGDSGHLTDEHFKHMAEVSGTNIRELESFCERCAGEAGDREREGSELSFDDIDAIASQYFDTSAKKINVQTVQSVIEEQYGVTHEELIGPRRNANIAKARHIAIYLAIEMCEMTTTAVGAEFGNRNHSTVSTSYKKVQKMIQEDRTVTEDLKSLRDKITLRS
ncbi:MAG: DnaA/Hda family protein [Collinsella sp.]|nr:DnaA/Hda family protein [Collinsella sp.]MCI7408709.1 DnaA/Hda family protein [Collinsella sp.]MDY3259269.1 DnaA/Hda family protein [Collinsella sp.]